MTNKKEDFTPKIYNKMFPDFIFIKMKAILNMEVCEGYLFKHHQNNWKK